MSGGNKDTGRTATSKVLGILEVFESSRYSMSLTEISTRACR